MNEQFEGGDWNLTKWKKIVNVKVREYGLNKWKSSMDAKSTLQWYKRKCQPACEKLYDGSYGSELLFKARSQSLEVNARTYRWNSDGSKLCKMCDSGSEETVYHVIVECTMYEYERSVFIEKLSEEGGDRIIREWYEDEVQNMCILLGIVDGASLSMMENMKVYLEKMWKRRMRADRGIRTSMWDHEY